MSIRTEKVSSLIQQVLARPVDILAKEYNAGLATVTAVRMTRDLHYANVFISVFGGKKTPAEFVNILEQRSAELRKATGSQIRLKYTPVLRFFVDDTLDKIDHIQELLDNVPKSENDDQLTDDTQ